MPNPEHKPPETTQFSFPDKDQLLVECLHAQYGHLDQGEARAKLEIFNPDVLSQEEFDAEFVLNDTKQPFVYVTRRADNVRGSLMYVDVPRLYFAFRPAIDVQIPPQPEKENTAE